MQCKSYCICGLGTEDFLKGWGEIVLREIEVSFYFVLYCLMLMQIYCDCFSCSDSV